MTQNDFYERHGVWITALGCVLLPLVIVQAKQTLDSNINDVDDWLPAQYAVTADYRWFRKHFGNDEYVLITWEGCTLEDSRLDRLEERIEADINRQDAAARSPFRKIVTGRSVVEYLTGEHCRLSPEKAVARLTGSLIGLDGRQTCAVVFLADDAKRDLAGMLDVLRGEITASGVPLAELRLGGSAVINVAIDRVSLESLYRVILSSFAVVLVISWCSFRNLRLMALVLITGIYSAATSLAVMSVCGAKMNAILITMIPMVYVTATSGAIHLCNYYQECVRETGTRGAVGRAIAHAWLPLGLSAATTAVGLLTICYNDLVLMKSFGLFSAVGVVLSWLLLMLWLPAALSTWPATVVAAEVPCPLPTSPAASETMSSETGEAPLPAVFCRWGEAVVRIPFAATLVCFLVVVACIPGLSRIQLTIDLMREIQPSEEVIRTYVWLEQTMGPLTPMEVIVRFDDETCQLSAWERVKLVERLQRRIETLDGVGGTISAATFVPESKTGGSAWLRQGITNARLRHSWKELVETGYLAAGEGEKLWRISARVAAMQEVDYAAFVEKLRSRVDPELVVESEEGYTGISVTYTGVAPVLFKARRSLMDGLVFGIASDLVLIVIAITVTMRHWSSGVLMMCTSLFPAIVVLGSVGWLGVKIDVGAVMAPCVALGVTVDDVIHFLLWFRWGVRRGLDRRRAVLVAWQACVRPMYQSWALLGLGMAALSVSSFVPILQFGAMMVALLTAGLAGNLLLLPALLAGPLGRVIASRCRSCPAKP
ncbi:MAG TPA: MMPL family transporter [Planctomycetaceae bacterium]|jgi:hypothetical protein